MQLTKKEFRALHDLCHYGECIVTDSHLAFWWLERITNKESSMYIDISTLKAIIEKLRHEKTIEESPNESLPNINLSDPINFEYNEPADPAVDSSIDTSTDSSDK